MGTEGRSELIYVRRIKDSAKMVILEVTDEWVIVAKTQLGPIGHGPPWKVKSTTFWTLYETEKERH